MKKQSAEDIKADDIRNEKLVQAMQAMVRHEDMHTRSVMVTELMRSRLLSPILRETVLLESSGPSTRIKFEDIENTDGDRYYLAFTDMDEYSKWNEDGTHDQALIMTMEDFGNLLIRNVNDLKGFVINPYGENVSISKKLLLSLLQQQEAKQNAKRGN
ncbi:MAG: SseB family protein [Eubacteriales bacterium]|nr:SseB family protein [Eubacteriales bacterium]